MKYLDSKDTIIACSSGNESNTGISIIRVSGFDFLTSLLPLFNLKSIEQRKVYFCKLVVDDFLIDEVLVTYFKGPNSYNGQDIFEISAHGNRLNVNRIINLLISKCHFRLAHPGEFTFRAYANKKLSLSQVEGLDLLINANSVFALNQGFSLMSGELKDNFDNLLKDFLNHKSSLELGFDFLEDVGEDQFNEEFKSSKAKLEITIKKLYSQVSINSNNLISPEIVLLGLPNAGKSSFFNKLLGSERAIVSDLAGTTRDFIKEFFEINNTQFSLIDTAGIRISHNKIEEEGIKRSLKLASNSFFNVLIINPFDKDLNYFESIKNLSLDLIIFSHSDLDGFAPALDACLKRLSSLFGPIGANSEAGPIGANGETGPIGANSETGPIGASYIPYLIIDTLVFQSGNDSVFSDIIYSKYQNLLDFDPILIERHREIIKLLNEKYLEYDNIIENLTDLAIISSELNILGHCISELIGIVSPDDVLHNIFDNFCIGK